MSVSTWARYTILPLLLGWAAFAAILTVGADGLDGWRVAVGFAAWITVTGGAMAGLYRLDIRRMEKRAADRDAEHRKATVAAFEADVERITGRPFPTDPNTEK